MKIAILNSWPNLTISAEREFIARAKLLNGALDGCSVFEVTTSDEIEKLEPDVVLITHEFAPKLTRYPTVGIIWSPEAYFGSDPDRVKSILSYDGYLVASESLRDYVKNLLARKGKHAPVSDFDCVPTALDVEEWSRPSTNRDKKLFYAGVHWDGDRHGNLFSFLTSRVPLKIYGDPKKWAKAGEAYAGTLPFDGVSVVNAIRECGVALAIHTAAHRAEGNTVNAPL